MEPIHIVEEVFQALRSWDLDRALALFDDNVVFHNMPTEPIRGREAVRQALEAIGTPSDVSHDVRNIIAQGELVVVERVENFVLNGRRVRLPIVAIAEVENGRVTAWRDYFDLATMMGGTPTENRAD